MARRPEKHSAEAQAEAPALLFSFSASREERLEKTLPPPGPSCQHPVRRSWRIPPVPWKSYPKTSRGRGLSVAEDDAITLGEVARNVGRVERDLNAFKDTADTKYVRADIHEREMSTVLSQYDELRTRFDNQEKINRDNQIRMDEQKAKVRLTWLGLGLSPILGVVLGQIAQGVIAGIGG